MSTANKIFYVEFPAARPDLTRAFFETVFGWKFTDYGPDYTSFEDGSMSGGFYRADLASTTAAGGALTVIKNQDLETTLAKVVVAAGKITKEIFAFPGGRRFHFTEPSGNELAVCAVDEGG